MKAVRSGAPGLELPTATSTAQPGMRGDGTVASLDTATLGALSALPRVVPTGPRGERQYLGDMLYLRVRPLMAEQKFRPKNAGAHRSVPRIKRSNLAYGGCDSGRL